MMLRTLNALKAEGYDMRTLRLDTASAVVLSLLLASSASADPDANHSTSGLTNPALLGLITNDDVFSTANLTIIATKII